MKYNDKIDFINLNARNALTSGTVTISIIKYTYDFNHYANKDCIINEQMISNKYSRYSNIEIWEYMIKY